LVVSYVDVRLDQPKLYLNPVMKEERSSPNGRVSIVRSKREKALEDSWIGDAREYE